MLHFKLMHNLQISNPLSFNPITDPRSQISFSKFKLLSPACGCRSFQRSHWKVIIHLDHDNKNAQMRVSEDSRKPLLNFVSDLIDSGCNSLGPQCNFVSEISDEHGSLIPSKCITEFFEAKYGNRNSYAPALGDFLSSHKGFFGTVRICLSCTTISNFYVDD